MGSHIDQASSPYEGEEQVSNEQDVDATDTTFKSPFYPKTEDVHQALRDGLKASSLPYEILAHIFEYLTQRCVFRCSWVCRSWRIASISYPTLWRTLDLRGRSYEENWLDNVYNERSGALPLVLCAPSGAWGFNFMRLDADNHLASRIGAVSNLTVTHFRPRNFTNLESAQLIVKGNSCILNLVNTKLRHLSIDLQEHPLKLGLSSVTRKLQTLHLHNQVINPTMLVQIVLDLPALEELALRHFPSREEYDPTAVDKILETASTAPHLKLLSLHNVSHIFLSAFVRPRLFQADTNVLLGQVDPHIRVVVSSTPPKLIPKRVWIDFWQLCVAYGCDDAIIRLEYEALEPTEDYIFPGIFSNSEVTDIWWYGGNLYSLSLRTFRSLAHMTFEYNPSPPSEEYFNLSDLLDDKLVRNCQNLSYLGILIRKARGSSVAYPDDSPHAVQAFVAYWEYTLHRSFKLVRVQDEINRGRWEAARPALEQYINRFEQGPVFEDLSLPEFPTLRPFFPETLDVDECDTYHGFFGRLWDVSDSHYYTEDQNVGVECDARLEEEEGRR